jgi:hypothetical protein
MSELSTSALSLIGIIAIAVAVPKYIKMPESLELLFQDRVGQILLLGLAAVIGSYNFAVGLMLAVFFMSLMVNTRAVEGFDNHGDFEEDFKEDQMENEDLEKEQNFNENPMEDEDLKKEQNFNEEPGEDENFSDTTQCNKINNSIRNLKALRTEMGCAAPTKQGPPKKSNKDKNKDEEEDDLVEGFGCSKPADNSNKKMNLKFVGKSVEPFQNQSLVQGHSDFDVAGCRYDLKQTGLNEDIYGPPLSSCNAYQTVNLEETGTVFYPLN